MTRYTWDRVRLPSTNVATYKYVARKYRAREYMRDIAYFLRRAARMYLSIKDIDMSSIEVDVMDHGDCPDYVDSFVTAASWKSGAALSDADIDELNERYPNLASELIIEGRFI